MNLRIVWCWWWYSERQPQTTSLVGVRGETKGNDFLVYSAWGGVGRWGKEMEEGTEREGLRFVTTVVATVVGHFGEDGKGRCLDKKKKAEKRSREWKIT